MVITSLLLCQSNTVHYNYAVNSNCFFIATSFGLFNDNNVSYLLQ